MTGCYFGWTSIRNRYFFWGALGDRRRSLTVRERAAVTNDDEGARVRALVMVMVNYLGSTKTD